MQLYRPRGVSPVAMKQRAAYGHFAGLGAAGSNPFAVAPGQNPSKAGAMKGAEIGASFGPIGIVIGAAVGAIGGAIMGSKRPESEIFDKYKAGAGNAQGHEYDNQFRNEAFVGLMRLAKNTFPPRLKLYGANDDAKFLKDMIGKVADAFRSGALNSSNANTADIYNKVVAPWVATMGTEKNAQWAGYENNILKDQIDAWLYDQPIIATSWTTSTWAQPRVTDIANEVLAREGKSLATPAAPATAPSSPGTALAVTPTPAVVNPGTPLTLPATPAIIASVPPPPLLTSATDPNLQTYLNALQAAGANQQQMLTAALQAMQNSGIAPTPTAQAAVADQVQTASVGGGVPGWVGALALVGLLFATARMHKGKHA